MHVGCRASLANKGGSAAELVRMAVRENEMLEVPQRAAQLSNGVESDGRLTGKASVDHDQFRAALQDERVDRSEGGENCPPNCPPRWVLLALRQKFYTKIFRLYSRT